MGEEASHRRDEVTERAEYHRRVQRQRSEEESGRAQALIDRFVAQARRSGLPTEQLTARPWSGRGRYRTGVEGWFLRRNRSVGVDVDGSFYVLNVPPVRFGRWRTVPIDPAPPPLVVGRGAGDGEVFDLALLLEQRLQWSESVRDRDA